MHGPKRGFTTPHTCATVDYGKKSTFGKRQKSP